MCGMELVVVDGGGNHLDRLSPWAPYVTCGTNYIYEQRFWNPPQVRYTLCPKKRPPYYVSNNSVKN